MIDGPAILSPPPESLPVPGRSDALHLAPDADGTVRWTVGDCTGNEATREQAIAVAQRYLGVRVLVEQAPKLRAQVRQVGPSSRRPGAGPTVGVTYVADRMPSSWRAQDMCHHGLPLGNCEACGRSFCVHPGALKHTCEEAGGAP